VRNINPLPLPGCAPQCHRCGEIIGTGIYSSVEVRYHDERRVVGRALTYHRECAPLFNGRLMKPGRVYVMPLPKVQNKKVTNDDGVHGAGIRALATALEPLGEVTIVAPAMESSAVGHALTLVRPLRLERIDERTHDHGRRISALEAKVWAAVAAGFTAFVGALFNLLGMGR
jgi:hypothetical protein